MKREWKPVKDYERLYEVSNFGEIKSLNYNHTGKEKLLKSKKDKYGYLTVNLYKNGVRKSFTIHRLVYETFVGEIPEDLQVNHIDEDKENNRVDNLNLMTPRENSNWGTRNARVADARKGLYNIKSSKAVEAIDKVTGRVVYVFPSMAEAGRQGFCQSNVTKCCRGKLKTHKCYIWRYKENAQE